MRMLASERLRFDGWSREDHASLYALHADPRVQRSYGPCPEKWSAAGITQRLDGYIAEQARHGFTKWKLSLADGTFVGRAGWSPWCEGTLEIGYALRPEFWGCGLGGEAAQALMDWAVATLPPWRLAGFALTHNVASQRILSRIGMTFIDHRIIAGVENSYFEWVTPSPACIAADAGWPARSRSPESPSSRQPRS